MKEILPSFDITEAKTAVMLESYAVAFNVAVTVTRLKTLGVFNKKKKRKTSADSAGI